MRPLARLRKKGIEGSTIMEVLVAMFIFSCISAVVFNLLRQTDRIRGRAIFVESATRMAAGEAERLRSLAACNALPDDTSYIDTASGRTFLIERTRVDDDEPPSYLPRAREPAVIELRVSDDTNDQVKPLRFKLLIGQDNP
jgi:Tfp pilus assembly protein PilV